MDQISFEWELLAVKKWETQHQGIISFKDMKDSHLNNTIWMIRRGIEKGTYLQTGQDMLELREAQLEELEAEQRRRVYERTSR